MFDWTNHNKLVLNWSKTKFMIINTKAGALRPVNIELENNLIEVVPEFKLLGCTIHDKLRFDKHLKNLKSAVCSKLFTFKNLFFLSFDIKVHFLKLFFSPISIIVPLYLYIFPIPYLTNCTNYIISACISYFVLNWITSILRLNGIFSSP